MDDHVSNIVIDVAEYEDSGWIAEVSFRANFHDGEIREYSDIFVINDGEKTIHQMNFHKLDDKRQLNCTEEEIHILEMVYGIAVMDKVLEEADRKLNKQND